MHIKATALVIAIACSPSAVQGKINDSNLECMFTIGWDLAGSMRACDEIAIEQDEAAGMAYLARENSRE